MQHYLPKICTEDHIKSKLIHILKNYVSGTMFTCEKHDVFRSFTNILTEFFIYSWIKNVNQILTGKDLRQRETSDVIKQLAMKRYMTYRKRKEALQKVKHLQ